MAAYYTAVEFIWHDTESPNLSVYLGNKKFTSAANLLFFSLDFCTRYDVSQDYSFTVKLNAAAFVVVKLANADKFLSICNRFAERDQRREILIRAALPVRALCPS